MGKDPAFLFYPGDWLGGTLGMTFEEKGAYLEILLLQFHRGHMTSHMIGQVLGQNGGQLWATLKPKFKQDEDGNWFNERLEIETTKRKDYVNSRKNNLKGINQFVKDDPHMNTHTTSHMTSHMENENENRNINKRKKGNGALPEWMNVDDWEIFLSHRKAIKAPITEKMIPSFVKKFESLKAQGYEPNIVIQTMLERGWRWFKPEWVQKEHVRDGLALNETFGSCPRCKRGNIDLTEKGVCIDCTRG